MIPNIASKTLNSRTAHRLSSSRLAVVLSLSTEVVLELVVWGDDGGVGL